MLQKYAIHRLIQTALEEDVGAGDITTTAALTGEEIGNARAVAKSDTVVAGIDVFRETFLFLDGGLKFTKRFHDGQTVKKGDIVAEISGNLASIMVAERVALNFFQRMCGVATMTRRFVDAIEGSKAKILHTRKTVPGLRILDTYAVRTGGGSSHRFGLSDGALVKDNHIAAAGSIARAVAEVRKRIPLTVKIEVEVTNIREVQEALAAGADVIMFDNMSLSDMTTATALVAGRVPLEASGNVSLDNVKKVSETGVDFISVGALTHSVKAADISLRVEGR
ncbi:MAG: carboxylating nicotinate-nucleotide diphosphorylase [Deltaproteobacteria bacterium]|nr:carboxylating nicotinate-nucleotide diphosphorylase [Deltaproteobacteria bacterium]